MTESDHEWCLAHLAFPSPGEPRITLGGPIESERLELLRSQTAYLSELLENSPFAALQRQHVAFRTNVQEVSNSSNNGLFPPDGTRKISDQLDNLLSKLRGFDDRTRSILSNRYGKDSAQFIEFGTAISFEFDNSFAYRFCYKLRNYSQHAGSPISRFSGGARLTNSRTEKYFNPIFESSELLARYDKWGSRVRGDLENIGGEFPVIETVDKLMTSCARAYNRIILSQEQDIERAASVILQILKEAGDELGTPHVASIKKNITKAEDLRNISLSRIRLDLAQAALAKIQDAKKIIQN
jgi:hypothetical protein